jgi:arginyl-tRNA synthetase
VSVNPLISQELGARVAGAVRASSGYEATVADALIRESAPDRPWDYQSNAAMGLAKRLGAKPLEFAQGIVDHLDVADLCEPPEVTPPGFINFRLRDDWLGQRLAQTVADPRVGVPLAPVAQRVVVDYSSPNAAKEMHVGHLRSTIIGDALVRLLRFAGHEVVPQNHVGDWGTPFGMLIEHLVDLGQTEQIEAIPDLNAFYREARVKFDGDEGFADRARRRVVALQAGEPETLTIWQHFIDESQRHFEDIYALLGVGLSAEDMAGESLYNSRLADTVAELEAKGLAVLSDGALCVFPPGFKTREGEPMPLILRKSDGGYTYDTTDLAAVRYRLGELGADRVLYVVGAPQKLHFELVFAAAQLAGWVQDPDQLRHIAFGSVLGEDNKMLRTRAGQAVTLMDLLRDAVTHAAQILRERGAERAAEAGEPAPEPSPELAAAIGVGAVKYADLSTHRERDYVFSLDRMLSLDGNTSVYLQYANTRALSVLARAGVAVAEATGPIVPAERSERELALTLARFPEHLDVVLDELAPHKLCGYLFSVATAFTSFYEQCPVLTADEPVKRSRLALCALTSRTLERGLDLLGIAAPERL